MSLKLHQVPPPQSPQCVCVCSQRWRWPRMEESALVGKQYQEKRWTSGGISAQGCATGMCVKKQLYMSPCRSILRWKTLGNIWLTGRLCCLTGHCKVEGREKTKRKCGSLLFWDKSANPYSGKVKEGQNWICLRPRAECHESGPDPKPAEACGLWTGCTAVSNKQHVCPLGWQKLWISNWNGYLSSSLPIPFLS